MAPAQLVQFSDPCFVLGFASIAVWFLTGGTGADTPAHAERFGIVVGFWAAPRKMRSARLWSVALMLADNPVSRWHSPFSP